MSDLTEEEEKAIASLKRLAKKWPKTLTLFSGGRSLSVRKGGIGMQHEVDFITGIPNDGGDGGDYID